MSERSKPAAQAFTVTKCDSTVFPATRALWVGVLGDVSVTMAESGSAIVFKGVQGLLPVSVTQVLAATTATDIVGLR